MLSAVEEFLQLLGPSMMEYHPSLVKCGVTSIQELRMLACLSEDQAELFLQQDVGMKRLHYITMRGALSMLRLAM